MSLTHLLIQNWAWIAIFVLLAVALMLGRRRGPQQAAAVAPGAASPPHDGGERGPRAAAKDAPSAAPTHPVHGHGHGGHRHGCC